MKSNLIFRVLCGLVAVVAISTSNAAGQSIGLDFGDQSGLGALPTNWNAVSNAASITDLVDLSGNSTGVGLNITNGNGDNAFFFNDDSHEEGSPNSLTGAGEAISPFTLGVAEDWSGTVTTEAVNRGDYIITFTGLTTTIDLVYDISAVVGAFTNNDFTDGLTITADGEAATLGDQSLSPRHAYLIGLRADESGNLEVRISTCGLIG